MSYQKMKKLYESYRWGQTPTHNGYVFIGAVGDLVERGFAEAKKITDEDIKETEAELKKQEKTAQKEHRFVAVSPDFQVAVIKCEKEIAAACENSVEFIQFCIAEDIYDIEFYANKPSHEKLMTLLENGINALASYGHFSAEKIIDTFEMKDEDVEMIADYIPCMKAYLEEQEENEER